MTGQLGPKWTNNQLDIENRTSKWVARKTEFGRSSNQEVNGLINRLIGILKINGTIKTIKTGWF